MNKFRSCVIFLGSVLHVLAVTNCKYILTPTFVLKILNIFRPQLKFNVTSNHGTFLL